MKPDTDAVIANKIFNDPSVYPHVCGFNKEYLDITALIENKNNYVLSWEKGVAVFVKKNWGLYELHSAILPEARGLEGITKGQEFFKWMFCNTDAEEIITKCPVNNKASIYGIRKHGFNYQFKTNPQWMYEGILYPVEVYSLRIENWCNQVIGMQEIGQNFHDQLHKSYKDKNLNIDTHEKDSEHDKRVGICVAMFAGNQAAKAINLYNRWAFMSNYEPILIISTDPLVVDIKEAKLQIKNGNFEVLECQ